MSCHSSRTTGLRPEMLDSLKLHNPDLLFFAGDQTYRHTEHTAGWIKFGLQFRDVIRDRLKICIPDDHDVGHPNLRGENGKRSLRKDNTDGGYFYPIHHVNQVQRQQTGHLPDPVDPAPVERGISVHFTRLTVGGVDFAILEDREFKSGPAVKLAGIPHPVVQVIAEATGEILYTVRSPMESFVPRVYAPGYDTIKAGLDKPDTLIAKGVEVA